MSRQLPSASLSASGGDDTFLGTRQDVSVPSSPPGHVLVGVCQSHSGMACYSLVRCCTSPQVGGTMSKQHLCQLLVAMMPFSALDRTSVCPPPLLDMYWWGCVRVILGWHATAWSDAVRPRRLVALCQGSFRQHLRQLLVAMMPFSALDRTSVCLFPSWTCIGGGGSEPFWDGMLQPGQMLYIPPGWWHNVKAASVSISVSFWWR